MVPELALLPRLRQRWTSWWEARSPRRDHLTLTQSNLYILPTRAGWAYAGVFLVLLLASVNEQVNLGYGLSFLLAGSALAALYLTHGNLHGVSLRLGRAQSVHAGQVLQVGVVLQNTHRRRGRFGLQITAGPKAPAGTTTGPGCPREAELMPGSDDTVEIDVAAPTRGWLALPRLTIETRFPFGWFRAWSYWRPETRVLIWPALDGDAPALPRTDIPQDSTGPSARARAQDDHLDSLRPYRRGDPVRRIAWKKSLPLMASGGLPVTRSSAAAARQDLLLDFQRSTGLEGLGTEQRLSRLATWLIEAERLAAHGGEAYTLSLPGDRIGPGQGPQHLRHCLDALAVWETQA